MKKYILIICFISGCIQVHSQSKWTLRQCIDYAIEHNIDIKQQEIKVEGAKNDLSTSKNSRLPDLNASASSGFSFGQTLSNSTNTYESQNSFGLDLGVSSSLPLFTGFKIPNQVKANELDLKAATEGLNKAKENMELQVTSYYLDVLFKKEILKAYQDQANLSEEQVTKTEILVNSGKIARSQLYDMKAQLAKDELNVTSALNDLDLSRLNLSQLLNLNENEGFDIAEPYIENVIEENQSSILPVSHIYQTAIAIKPHVKEAQYNIESSKRMLKVAQANYYPTIDLNLNYRTSYQYAYGLKPYDIKQDDGTIKTINPKNASFGSQLNNLGREYIGLSVSIPIFNRFQTRNQVRAARLQIQSNELALDNVKQALFKEIQQAYQSAVAARSKYNSTEKAYESADEAFKYAKERYDVGKLNVFEFSEAQTKLLTSKSEQIQAKYDFLFRAKILDFYSGKEIDIK